MKSSFRIDLSRMPQGVPGRIVAVEGVDDVARLQMLGLCAGQTVEVVKTGDPMIVRVLGTRIGLAGALARGVQVEMTCSA